MEGKGEEEAGGSEGQGREIVEEGKVRLAKGVDGANEIDGAGEGELQVDTAKPSLAALSDVADKPGSPTLPRARPRSPSTASTTSLQNQTYLTPVGTLPTGSTLKLRAKDGRQSIYFDPTSTNPFLPISPILLPAPYLASNDAATPPTEEQDHAVVSPADLPLLPLPSSSSPAIALHAFTGQPDFGELSFAQGDSLRIEIEDVGGGWSLGFIESEGEGTRGLVPRGWYACVDGPVQTPPHPFDSATSNKTLHDAVQLRPTSADVADPDPLATSESTGSKSLGMDSSEPYATRSIGRHVVVSGTEFEPTWVADAGDTDVAKSETEGRNNSKHGAQTEDQMRQVPVHNEDRTREDKPVIAGDGGPATTHAAQDAPVGGVYQSFLFRIGLAPFFDTSTSTSSLSRFLPALGRTPVPGASILAATAASSAVAAAPSPARPRLPRLETHRASKLPDGKALLLRWIEQGDELDEMVEYGEDGDGSDQCFDIESGPAWRSRRMEEAGERAEVFVADPKKCSPLNESPFVVFTVTTSFPFTASEPDDGTASSKALCVDRRYSHFAALHTVLASRFLTPLICVPPLPPRGPLAFGAARFDAALLERRRKELERWIRRCLRHAVLGESEEMKGFLAIDGEKELSAHLLISIPPFNIDLAEAEDTCDRFERHCQAIEVGGGMRQVAEAVRMGREQKRAALGVTGAVQAAGEAFADVAGLENMAARTGLLEIEEQLLSISAPLSQYAPLIELHRSLITTYRRLARLSSTSASDQLARCETALNIAAAEMDRIGSDRTEDLAEAVRGWLETTISVHEKSLEHLRFALDRFSPSSLANLAFTGRRLRSPLDRDEEPLPYPPLPRAGVYERGLGGR
ncbi:sh3px3 protein [Rhodotorula toruloides]|uniref:Sh3px3 protein n=1 Tax=Rhodotorula toruloides TaxID=5286 RepID=A0A511KAR1_RHOTO|nr:sh3px3 protein [Rhodotorula toruloides]